MATDERIAKNVALTAGDANKEEQEVNLESGCWLRRTKTAGRKQPADGLDASTHGRPAPVHNPPPSS